MPLVVLSIVIILTASYTSFSLSGRMMAAQGVARRMWLVCGALAMGTGIWSMHFVGMLAFELPVDVSYDLLLVVLSVLPAIMAAVIAMFIISHPRMSGRQVVQGSLSMGTGIALMHYTGMAAMQMPASIRYDPLLFILSLVIAFLASAVALYLLYFLRDAPTSWKAFRLKLGSAFVMSLGVSGMHYTGMAASIIQMDMSQEMSGGLAINTVFLGYTVGLGTLILLGFALLGTFVDRLFASQTRRLDYTELRYKSLFEHNSDAVFTLSLNGYFTEVNPAAERLFGYSALQLRDKQFLPFVAEEDVERVIQNVRRVERGQSQNVELAITCRDDRRVHIQMTGVPLLIKHKVSAVCFIAQNITERKKHEAEINYMAFHDDLTRLPNRRKFIERMTAEVEQSRSKGAPLYVMILDMDRFKNYNDTLGHAFGDDLLVAFAERLRNFQQEGTIVARLGGDEFTVLITNRVSVEEAERVAQSILKSIAQPFFVRGHELSVTTSIGIAVFPEDGEDVETLMKNADTAMYRAKERGNRYQLYNPAMNPKAYEKIVMEIDLRKALERDEFLVYYQPQVDLETLQIKGVEALVRWMHKDRGLVSPGQFIPIAEESGLIVPIGQWVLRSACLQGKRWHAAGYDQLRVSVNLSLRQFQDHDLVKNVEQVLLETEFPPECLELEITESMTMDVERAIQVLQELKRLNVQVAIDDFGTGYSSLSYLKRFPIDRLKIDQSFVRDIHVDIHDAEIVTTIISMAHNLHLMVTAEGVETADQLAFLQEYGCEEAQGYYFARPLPAEDVQRLLKEHSESRLWYPSL